MSAGRRTAGWERCVSRVPPLGVCRRTIACLSAQERGRTPLGLGTRDLGSSSRKATNVLVDSPSRLQPSPSSDTRYIERVHALTCQVARAARSHDRLGSDASPLPKPSLIVPNPAVSGARVERRNPRQAPGNQASQRVRPVALQAGGHRFDPGWLHSIEPEKQRLYARCPSSRSPNRLGSSVVLLPTTPTGTSVETSPR
jgi:hypothetical protein